MLCACYVVVSSVHVHCTHVTQGSVKLLFLIFRLLSVQNIRVRGNKVHGGIFSTSYNTIILFQLYSYNRETDKVVCFIRIPMERIEKISIGN